MRRKSNLALASVLAAVAAAGALIVWASQGPSRQSGIADVVVPELTKVALEGKALFDKNCILCHGKNAAGSNDGPPLIHVIYETGHHADYSFVMAVKNGTRAHHWGFGDMPSIPGVTNEEITTITRYVRELQRANGIN